ncbi:MAG: hypothetical protein JWP95_2018 [Actinotalea sp.]|nr:hypothetical protein [Actinotalea sp.]
MQHFWAGVVGEGLDADSISTVERPDDAALARFVAQQATALVTALVRRSGDESCYSWHEDGGSVGWVARRQAHEALIHRVDAEQAGGTAVRPPTLAMAVDGVDEVLRVMVDGVPSWGAFVADGVRVDLAATDSSATDSTATDSTAAGSTGADAAGTWSLVLGRVTGTSPHTGNVDDLDAASVLDGPDRTTAATADVTVAGTAWDLDLWLWGRGSAEALEVRGDTAVVDRFRALAAEATQEGRPRAPTLDRAVA